MRIPDSCAVDVIVVGGGPAGLATAIGLLRAGFSVLVVERTDFRTRRIGEHLPPEAKWVLGELGLGDALRSGGHASCPGVCSVWGSREPVDRHYLFHPNGEGLNLSRPDFDSSLCAVVERLGGVVFTEATVAAVARVAGTWQVSTRWGGVITARRCRVIVDATGRNASVARRVGARAIVYDELIGIVGSGVPAAAHHHVVQIEALEEGWWYSAGLADGTVIAAFMTDAGLVDTTGPKRYATWLGYLERAHLTGARLKGAGLGREVHVRTARTQRLDKVADDGWIATGDAAMSFDPLSSAGISKALESGTRAATVAGAMCRGDASPARAYQDEVGRAFAQYLVRRYRYYAAERRWSDAPFWRRRLQPPAPIGAGAFASSR